MQQASNTPVLNCTQCGGELHPQAGQIFLTCPYCSASVYIDKAQVVFHWLVPPTLNEEGARGTLARWMAGNQTVKDLDQKARLSGQNFEYFPIWYFKRRQPNGTETILIEPAAATSVSELRGLKLPAGALKKYTTEMDSQSHAPSVPLPTALSWLAERRMSENELVERALVHIPLYTFKYAYLQQEYTALVEASTGSVFANIFPAKAEAPYLLAASVTALVYLCLALIPLFAWATDGWDGLATGLLICSGLGLLAAPFLFALALWVAAKV